MKAQIMVAVLFYVLVAIIKWQYDMALEIRFTLSTDFVGRPFEKSPA